jgi:hypothetical protein
MSTIVTRSGKGSPLTHVEVDANFTNLNTDKIQSGNTVAALTITSASVVDLAVTGITSFDGSEGTAGQVLTSAGTGNTPAWGDVVTPTGTQTLTNKTLTDPAIIGTILEDVYTISDGAAFEIDPSNGSIQIIVLGASRTPKGTNFAAGEAITLLVDDGTDYAITWTDATFGTGGVTWVGGTAPTLATSGYTVIELWKVGTKVYGASIGGVA